jgi:hypothetical protein
MCALLSHLLLEAVCLAFPYAAGRCVPCFPICCWKLCALLSHLLLETAFVSSRNLMARLQSVSEGRQHCILYSVANFKYQF